MNDHRRVHERLPWLVAGSLPPEEAEGVRAHLADCSECRAELARTEFAARLYAAEHPTSDELVDVAWGRLDRERSSAIEAHAGDCADCAEALALARASRDAESAARPNTSPPPRAVSPWRLAWAASTLVLAAAVVWLLMQQTRPGAASHTVLAGVPVIELLPETALRGDPTSGAHELARPSAASIVLLLALERPSEHAAYSARLRDEEGHTLLESAAAAPDATGALSLLVPTDLLPEGPLFIEVLGDGHGVVARYPLSVVAGGSSQPSTTNGVQ